MTSPSAVPRELNPTARQPVRIAWPQRRALLAALLILLPLAVFAGAATVAAINAYRAADEERLASTARALAAAVDARLAEKITALKVLAESRRLNAEVSADAFKARMNPVGDHLNGRLLLLGPPPDLRVLAISHPLSGIELPAPVPPEVEGVDSRFVNTVFEDRRPFLSNLHVGPLSQRLILLVAVPVARDGQPPRALALSFEPTALRGMLVDQALPTGTFAAIADGRHRILAHSRDPEGAQIGRPAPAWVDEAITGRQRVIVQGPGWSGGQNIYAVERLTHAPEWTVTVAEPVAAQRFAAMRAVRWLLAGGLSLALGLAAAVWVSRQEALRDVQREADALRQGKAEVERLHGGLPVVIYLREVAPDNSSQLLYRGGDIETVTGWPAAEIDRRGGLAGLLVGDDAARVRTDLNRQVFETGSITYQWQACRPDGRLAWLQTSIRVLERYPDGGGLVVGYAVDISLSMQAQADADAARQELDATLAAAPVAVFRGCLLPDGTMRRTFLSRAIERLTGWPYDALAHAGAIRAIMTSETLKGRQARLSALQQDGVWQGDLQLRRPDDSFLWARVRMIALEKHDDGAVDVVGYLLDVTAEREAQSRAMASARLASLGEMAAGLAHELRQPLAVTALAAENAQAALEAGNLGDVEKRLKRINEQMLRAGQVIDHLRRFSSGPEVQIHLRPVRLDEALDGVRALIDGALRDANVVLDVDLGEQPLRVMGDVVALEQVLVNLLSNARDALASLPPQAPRRVRVSAKPGTDNTIVLRVADTGGGIAPEVLPRLFEPFVSTKGPDKGTGLGLSICHGLVASMGGTIEAANGPEGAVLTITLRSAAAAPPLSSDSEASNGT